MGAVISPAILATDKEGFQKEMHKVAGYAHRIQIDLTDREFAKPKTIAPHEVWWPVGLKADIHLMYKQPLEPARQLISHKPHLIIVHAESHGDFKGFVDLCRSGGTKVGIALLPETPPATIYSGLGMIDHVLIFSGDLGHYGGTADLNLLEKVAALKARKPDLEVGWDGGADDQNIARLVLGGVDVVNVGGYIQNAADPHKAYQALQRIADETGTA